MAFVPNDSLSAIITMTVTATICLWLWSLELGIEDGSFLLDYQLDTEWLTIKVKILLYWNQDYFSTKPELLQYCSPDYFSTEARILQYYSQITSVPRLKYFYIYIENLLHMPNGCEQDLVNNIKIIEIGQTQSLLFMAFLVILREKLGFIGRKASAICYISELNYVWKFKW